MQACVPYKYRTIQAMDSHAVPSSVPQERVLAWRRESHMPGFSVRLGDAVGMRETVGLWSAAGGDEGRAVLRVLMDLGQQVIDEAARLVRRNRLVAPFVVGQLVAHDDTAP